ncbi:MAG: right-handed parallel beta-helix repeat-containing protein [Candidatus Thermoplasmatota archaeon]|nr:right-handed parallel beta-helix repeat-containing protein [Candidatus Thermoplasmatota archaeon]
MNHPAVSLLVALSLLCTVITVPGGSASTLSSGPNTSRTIIYVDDSNIHGPWDGSLQHPFQRIQDGINVSTNEDLVYIFTGSYNESLAIHTGITLFGEPNTVLEGKYGSSLITLWSEHVTVQNLILQHSGGAPDDAGLHLYANETTLSHCTFSALRTGIDAQGTSGHHIDNCTFSHNGIGLQLSSAHGIIVRGCTFTQNAIGLYCTQSSDILVLKNLFQTNGRACFLTDCHNLTLNHCNISDNSVNHGGVFLGRSSAISITQTHVHHNGIGVRITNADAVDIQHCSFERNTHYAVLIDTGSTKINVTSCAITQGLRFGGYIVDHSHCTFLQNNIQGNMLYGVYTLQSTCALQGNYWGARRGPSITDLGCGDRIHPVYGTLRSFPWMTHPFPDAGALWTENEPYWNFTSEDLVRSPITFPETDTDGDGAPDWWEQKWGYNQLVWDDHEHLDPDADALTNLEECYTDAYGSNPFHQDIFVELDWMTSADPSYTNKPCDALLTEAIDVFAEHNITLHLDVGNLGGGQELPLLTEFSFLDLVDLYWHSFLNDDPLNPRKGIFRYGIICDAGPDVNFPFMGWDQFDSFLVSTQLLAEQFPLMNRCRLGMYAAVHHLGHTLGLVADTYDGIDNIGTLRPLSRQWFLYRNYQSCMNYWYKFRTFSYSDGTHGPGDFDDYAHLDFWFFKHTDFHSPS